MRIHRSNNAKECGHITFNFEPVYVLINLCLLKYLFHLFFLSFHTTKIVLIDLKKKPSVFFYSYLLSSHNDRCINILI